MTPSTPHSKKYYTLADWQKTPYATSKADDTESAMNKLLAKYGVVHRQWTDHPGPNGRPAVTLRFSMAGLTYRVTVETLDVPRAEAAALRRQVLRNIFWTIKPLLENSLLFGGPDRLLLPFVEADDLTTVYDRLAPHLRTGPLAAKDLLGAVQQLALPEPGETEAT